MYVFSCLRVLVSIQIIDKCFKILANFFSYFPLKWLSNWNIHFKICTTTFVLPINYQLNLGRVLDCVFFLHRTCISVSWKMIFHPFDQQILWKKILLFIFKLFPIDLRIPLNLGLSFHVLDYFDVSVLN